MHLLWPVTVKLGIYYNIFSFLVKYMYLLMALMIVNCKPKYILFSDLAFTFFWPTDWL